MKNSLKKKKGRNDLANNTRSTLLPILFILAIVPIMVYSYVDKVSQIESTNFLGDNTHVDVFFYYKSIFVSIAAILSIAIYIYSVSNNRLNIKKSNIYFPTAIYGLLIIISTLASQYKGIAVIGFVERYEGMIVLLSYLIVFVYTFNIVNCENQISYISRALTFSSVIICIIGIFQMLGYDLFFSEFARTVLYHAGVTESIVSPFDKNAVYSTLGNQNYVGSFVCLALPFILLSLFRKEKVSYKITTAIISIALVVVLIGSKSRAGFVGIGIVIILSIIIFRKEIWKKKILFTSLGLGCIMVIIALNVVANGIISKKVVEVLKLNTETQGVMFDLQDIELVDNSLKVTTSKETLSLKLEGGTIGAFDDAGKIITLYIEEDQNGGQKISIKDERYKDYHLRIKDNILNITNNNANFSFLISEDNGFLIIGEGKKATKKISHPTTFGFKNKETLGSARGYIWSRTIPMLKDTIFKGYGPDIYAIEFPQSDYVGKIRAYGIAEISVTKPHNLYLQIGVNTGVISLIAVLALFCIYIIECFRLYCTKIFDTRKSMHLVGVSIFLSNCGYLAAGFFNDSVVAVAPIFWVLLGVGFACNRIIKNEKAG